MALWESCGLTRPWNDPRADIERKVRDSPDWFFVAEVPSSAGAAPPAEGGTSREAAAAVVGTVMAGYDGHRGWINYLATDPAHRGRGIGRALMAAAERELAAAGCAKINLQVRSENAAVIAFYSRLGYVQDPVVSMGKRLIDDRR